MSSFGHSCVIGEIPHYYGILVGSRRKHRDTR